MTRSQILQGCELHIHMLGAFYVDDVLALGRDVYHAVDWHANRFLESYQEAFGLPPNPIRAFEEALANHEPSTEHLKHLHSYTQADAGDFARFQAKFNFFLCLWDYYRSQGPHAEALVLHRLLERARSQNLDYIEYRYGLNILPDFLRFHQRTARFFRDNSGADLTAHYIIGLPRWAALEGYALVQQLLAQHPDLIPTIVGLDFAGFEEGNPPKLLRPFFAQAHKDNQAHPERALDIVYHVGESFFDKSLESAIRWCHEIAEMGAHRLGHAIALGLAPTIAIARRPQAHIYEPASERLDQIAYDLHYAPQLMQYDIPIDKHSLLAERQQLTALDPTTLIERPYNDQRLSTIQKRQDFVLDRLKALGTVIECCPTSNLLIGGVPDPSHHPIHRFLASGVNLTLCSDDPGTFDITLASEIAWALEHTQFDEAALYQHLGDPRRFRLGQRNLKRGNHVIY